jgi:hypothetical protein
MAVGDTLHRIARGGCSSELCSRVLEPAIADLQHQYAQSRRAWLRPLLGGYAAFWWSFASCLARDAVSRESRGGVSAAAVAFALVVGALGACEMLLLHTLPDIRMATFRVLYGGSHLPYAGWTAWIGWSAWIDTGTLMFGVPLAMFPALLHAARRGAAFAPGAALMTIALGTLLTIASSGWIAPAVVRRDAIRQHGRFVAGTAGQNVRIRPIDLDGCPDCQAWPDLIRGAAAPLEHRYPGYPNYVAPEDRGLPEWYRAVIRERLFLIAFALLAGLAGWWLGTRSRLVTTPRNARNGPHRHETHERDRLRS